MSIELMMPSNYLILCHPLFLYICKIAISSKITFCGSRWTWILGRPYSIQSPDPESDENAKDVEPTHLYRVWEHLIRNFPVSLSGTLMCVGWALPVDTPHKGFCIWSWSSFIKNHRKRNSSSWSCVFVSLGGSDSKISVYNAGDPGSIPGLRRSPGEGNGNPLQDYYLENPMDRGAW